jgi:predicted transcriptional regulator
MQTAKTRHQFYLPDSLSEKLETLAAKPGASKTAILTDALNAWLERKGAQELDQRFGPRLDRLSRAAERSEHKVDALTELVGTFVQHQLTLTAHQAPFDDAAGHLGRQRFHKLLDLVEQRLARGGTAARLSAPTPPTGDDT